MAEHSWTDSQRAAIETLGCSVLVSAGAGSGKTAVLAERCARLLADPQGCDADQLLVVTFTDAAAAEMRERIAGALRRRLAESPGHARFQRQLALLDGAWISTIHSFCRRVLNRFFAYADIDPDAPILDANDTKLLRRETVKRVFDESAAREHSAGEAFLNLLDAYGGSSDERLQALALQVAEFLNSLPDPEDWIDQTRRRFAGAAAERLSQFWLERLVAAIRGELAQQIEAIDRQLEDWRQGASLQSFLDCLSAHRGALAGWQAMIERDPTAGAIDRVSAEEIAAYKFPAIPAKKGKAYTDLDDAAKAAFAAAQDRANAFKKRFEGRLKRAFGSFRVDDWADGLCRTAPHVLALLDLVEAVRAAYQAAKTDLGVLDFSDLECKTLALLRDESNGVARRLRDRFRFVLVDEFQDTNRVQAELLRLVSREAESAPGPWHRRLAGEPASAPTADSPSSHRNNLFAVGDVKQSIYRFRLAEPRLFLERAERSTWNIAEAIAAGTACVIDLAENFRSTPGVIDAVNAIFEKLMAADLGGIDYDEHARLRPGRTGETPPAGPALSLHVLAEPERDSAVEDEEAAEAFDWERIEREAHVIAQEIRRLVDGGRRYGDVVILLRSMQRHVGLFVRALSQHDIPVFADAGGSLFEALEVMDVLALLRLLDNEQQDIPLVALLRSPLAGEPLSDDQLVEIRASAAGDAPFFAAARRYARAGDDVGLKKRLAAILERLARWRTEVRRRPLADVLWQIYEESGYLAYVQGLRDGLQRRANLIQLHEYARTFGSFERQGRSRFLRFLDGLREAGEELEPGSAAAPTGDVVRVMTIHRSKGLEFPVVIVGELGKQFNLRDASGSILFDRQLGLGLEAVDPQRRIIYPTLPHRLVTQAARLESLAEELRVLYVALTRAREHIILVGTGRPCESAGDPARPGALPLLERAAARSMLDWVTRAVASQQSGVVHWHSDQAPPAPGAIIAVRNHTVEEMGRWRLPSETPKEAQAALRSLAELRPARSARGQASDADVVSIVSRRLLTPYPAAALTRIPAVAAASALKRRWTTLADEDEPADEAAFVRDAAAGRLGGAAHAPPILKCPQFIESEAGPDPTSLGTWTHEFLQRIELPGPRGADDLRRQLNGLVDAGAFTKEQAEAIDLGAVAWFFATPLGKTLAADATRILREWPFVLGVDPARYDPAAGRASAGDVMLVRGIIDVLFNPGDGWQVLDYKTDRVSGDALKERAALYAGQLDIYAAAVEAVRRIRPQKLWLVFLAAREIVAV